MKILSVFTHPHVVPGSTKTLIQEHVALGEISFCHELVELEDLYIHYNHRSTS